MEIRKGFLNKYGKYFDNILDVNFDDFVDFRNNLGEFITQSSACGNPFFKPDSLEDSGVYLYRTKINPSFAFRIYKDVSYLNLGLSLSRMVIHADDLLISRLKERQKNVILSDFPLGVVTIGNCVVGQLIYYYFNSLTVADTLLRECDLLVTKYYIGVLEVLKEMAEQEIIYGDAHFRNFIVLPNSEVIKPIDFEPGDVLVPEVNQSRMIEIFKSSVNSMNRERNIDFELIKPENVSECMEELLIQDEKLKKRKREK